jgi:hypothetical protein
VEPPSHAGGAIATVLKGTTGQAHLADPSWGYPAVVTLGAEQFSGTLPAPHAHRLESQGTIR